MSELARTPSQKPASNKEFHKAHHLRFNLGHITSFSHAVAHLRHKNKDVEHPADLSRLDCRDFICVVFLCTTYVTFIFCRNFANPLAPALVEDTWGYTNAKHTSALVLNGVAYGVGKMINGIIVNASNPRVCLFVYIIGSSGLVFFFSFLKTFATTDDGRYSLLLAFWAANSYLQSGADSAFTKYTYERFRPEQYASVFSFICLGSRLGAVAASLCLGALLSEFAWPEVAKLAALITVCGTAFLFGTFTPCSDKPHAMPHNVDEHKDQADKIKQENPGKHGCRLYASWWTNPRFLFMAASTGCLGVLSVVDAIIGLWISDVFNPTVSVSGMACAALPMGIVISIPFFGFVIPRFEPKGQSKGILTLVGILVMACVGLVILTAVAESMPPNPGLVLLGAGICFVYGLMLGFPYYVPPAVFALDFGHANGGMVATFIDLVSAVLSAGTSIAVGYLSLIHWSYVWALILVLSITAWCTLAYWHVINLRWIEAGRPE